MQSGECGKISGGAPGNGLIRHRPALRQVNPRRPQRSASGSEYSMQQSETQLIYWAPSRVRFNLTLILAGVVIALGLLQSFGIDPIAAACGPARTAAPDQTAPEGAPPATDAAPQEGNRGFLQGPVLLIIVGLGVGAYSWLTSPRQYRVYPDALVIMYGMPRNRRLHFSQIREVANDRNFMGDPLRVYTSNRRRIPIQVHEPDAFYDYLQPALDDFRRQNPEYMPPPEPQTPESAPSESTDADIVDAPSAADAASTPPSDAPPPSADTAPPSADGSSGRGRRRRRSLRGDDDHDSNTDGTPPGSS